MVKILEVKNLNYQMFKNINLSFECNTIYSIVGPNNCGKTLLFKLLTGLINTENYITCYNITLSDFNKNEYIKNIGVVECVNKKSFLFKNVIDELVFPLYNLNYSKRVSLNRINKMLELFKLENIIKKNINDLTLYEKQKLLIIIALLHKPKVLLIDSALNIFGRKECHEIMNVLRKLTIDEDLSIINFTSNLNESLDSDYLLLLNNYQILKVIKKSDLINNDKLFYENNLEIPFIIDLNTKLNLYNLVNNTYNDVKDLVNEIWQ